MKYRTRPLIVEAQRSEGDGVWLWGDPALSDDPDWLSAPLFELLFEAVDEHGSPLVPTAGFPRLWPEPVEDGDACPDMPP